jgi:hypothetical protein
LSISQYVENLIAKLDLPIVTLEVRRMMRGKWSFKTALIAVSIGSALLIAILFLWIADNRSNMLTKFDPEIFSCIVAALLIAAKLVILFSIYPVYSSRIIAENREMGAFPMLAMTPLKSREIILQYFGVGLAHVILITLLSAPIIVPAITSLEHNSSNPFITLDSIVFNILVYPIAGALYIAIGLLCSCIFSKATSAGTASTISIVTITWILYKVYSNVFSHAPEKYSGMIHPSIAQFLPTLFILLLGTGITALLISLSSSRFEHMRKSL